MFNQSVIHDLPAHKWWKVMSTRSRCNNEESKHDMCIFFSKLHSCPASSAAIERIFSTFGLVWSKLGDRLGAEKVEKLVIIYRYSQIKDKIK